MSVGSHARMRGVSAAGNLASGFSTFAPEFARYQVVVMNYDAPDERWPAALKNSFTTR